VLGTRRVSKRCLPVVLEIKADDDVMYHWLHLRNVALINAKSRRGGSPEGFRGVGLPYKSPPEWIGLRFIKSSEENQEAVAATLLPSQRGCYPPPPTLQRTTDRVQRQCAAFQEIAIEIAG
jgi:hypothetical protein